MNGSVFGFYSFKFCDFFFCFIILKTLLNWIFKILFDAQILLHV